MWTSLSLESLILTVQLKRLLQLCYPYLQQETSLNFLYCSYSWNFSCLLSVFLKGRNVNNNWFGQNPVLNFTKVIITADNFLPSFFLLMPSGISLYIFQFIRQQKKKKKVHLQAVTNNWTAKRTHRKLHLTDNRVYELFQLFENWSERMLPKPKFIHQIEVSNDRFRRWQRYFFTCRCIFS